ncbi:hypothetical protein GCM10009640_15790 [Agrococcus citreus]|uniref:Major facilitator superfamily (MFS) profile domain-containing protein n=2 Tax=Agrococcus citreus TaxID=84643 RepID=A0ABN1YU33_9MICO
MPFGAPSWQPQPQPYPQQGVPFPLSTPRPPLPEAERRRLLRLGAGRGALLGFGTGLGGTVLLLWATVLGISALVAPLVIGFGGGDPLGEGVAAVVTPLTVAVLAGGSVLCLLALVLSWFGLRRWGGGRAAGVTAAAAAIASVPVHLVNIAIFAITFALQPELDESTGIAIIALVAGLVGAVVGAAAGAGAWRWMGAVLRPRR